MMKRRVTARGFKLIEFEDRYGSNCSLQESSLAEESAIWFGVDKDFATGVSTRMHLTQDMVKELLPALKYFAKHGYLPED